VPGAGTEKWKWLSAPTLVLPCPICFAPFVTVTATCEPGRAGATEPPTVTAP
jgi:hypothetical protein